MLDESFSNPSLLVIVLFAFMTFAYTVLTDSD